MKQAMLLLSSLIAFLTSSSLFGEDSVPLSKEGDVEYRATLDHFKEVIPSDIDPLVAMRLLSPYAYLDVHPTLYSDLAERQSFANFNFGVILGGMMGLEKTQIENLPSLMLCYEVACREKRINAVNSFFSEVNEYLEVFKRNSELKVVQQLSTQIYRINNVFISPVEVLLYEPSESAGFVPSGQYQQYKALSELPDIQALSQDSQELIDIMNKHRVNALVRMDSGGLNIIFEGFADNHWGVVFYEKNSPEIKVGDTNPLGFEYDDIEKISDNLFYYQTN